MNAYRKFLNEMQQLELLHLGTLYSYDQALNRAADEVQQGKRDLKSPITRTLTTNYHLDTVAANHDSLRKRLHGGFPRQLREVLFVRVISVMEVYLIDAVRDTFLARSDLFLRREKIEISQAQMLSFKSRSEIATYLINRECRSLQNAGFTKIRSYYKQRLGIDFGGFEGGLARITEYHDRRHLLVHRLGHTDSKYRHDYQTEGSRISVPRKYFIEFLKVVRDFASFVEGGLKRVRSEDFDRGTPTAVTGIVSIDLQLLSEEGRKYLDDHHPFASGDRVVYVGDIIASRTELDPTIVSLELRGPLRIVERYIRYLKSLKQNQLLQILDVRYLRRIGRRKRRLPDDLMREIELSLPPMPWPAGIHRRVAHRFGISNAQAFRAISRMRARVPDSVISTVAEMLPLPPWPHDIHLQIASALNLSPHQAYEAIRQVRLTIR